MTTKQIDYILELSQTLNFNRAAENMFISQPTLTYQIKLAEEEIGFNIFERVFHLHPQDSSFAQL
jgi:DNA-binding transcriptional LysR family regulator